jgi:hypothetical protein
VKLADSVKPCNFLISAKEAVSAEREIAYFSEIKESAATVEWSFPFAFLSHSKAKIHHSKFPSPPPPLLRQTLIQGKQRRFKPSRQNHLPLPLPTKITHSTCLPFGALAK